MAIIRPQNSQGQPIVWGRQYARRLPIAIASRSRIASREDLERAQTLATMLAHSRAARAVEVADLLAGMYIYDWERLSQFWEDQDEIEHFPSANLPHQPAALAPLDSGLRSSTAGDEEPRKVVAIADRPAKSQAQPSE